MFKITIISVGKIKKTFFKEAVLEYLKRLGPYANIDIVEIEAESFSENKDSKLKSQHKEGEKILKFLAKYNNAEIIILDEGGKSFTSKEFAKFLEAINKHIVFVIGGTLGFSDEIKKQKFTKLSLSPMTFPHEMAKVVILEQIFRAVTILKNKEYHY